MPRYASQPGLPDANPQGGFANSFSGALPWGGKVPSLNGPLNQQKPNPLKQMKPQLTMATASGVQQNMPQQQQMKMGESLAGAVIGALGALSGHRGVNAEHVRLVPERFDDNNVRNWKDKSAESAGNWGDGGDIGDDRIKVARRALHALSSTADTFKRAIDGTVLPGTPMPPMGSAMQPGMQGGMPPGMPPVAPPGVPPGQPGMPPVDPNTGMPMDPSMMGGAPPPPPGPEINPVTGGMGPMPVQPTGVPSPKGPPLVEELAALKNAPEDRTSANEDVHDQLAGQGGKIGVDLHHVLNAMTKLSADRVFVLGGQQSTPESSLLTNIGAASSILSGGTALASLGVNRAANAASTAVRKHDPFLPTATANVRGFNEATLAATTPAAKIRTYVDHGHVLMSSPAFKSGLTGRDVMEKLYTNPLISAATGNNDRWTPEKARHYGEFAKSPMHAYHQLAREIHGGDATSSQVVDEARSSASDSARDAAGKVANRLKRQADAAAEKLNAKLGGKWYEHKGRSPQADAIQKLYDRYDAVVRRSPVGDGAASAAGGDAQARLRSLQKAFKLDPNTAGLYAKMYDFAVKNEPASASLLQGSNGQRSSLFSLPKAEQAKLIEAFSKSPQGAALASEFAKKWAGPMSQYRMLGSTMATPKKVIDAALLGSDRLAGGSAKVGKGALLAMLPSLAAYFGGKSLDARSAARGAEASRAKLIAAIKAELGDVKLAAAVRDLGGSFSHSERSGPRPPKGVKAKVSVSGSAKVGTLDKEAFDTAKFLSKLKAGLLSAVRSKTNKDFDDVIGANMVRSGKPWPAKSASQDNSAPQRSATGDSKGLRFQILDDHHAKGKDAWDVRRYSKTYSQAYREKDDRIEHSKRASAALASLIGVEAMTKMAGGKWDAALNFGKGLFGYGKHTAESVAPSMAAKTPGLAFAGAAKSRPVYMAEATARNAAMPGAWQAGQAVNRVGGKAMRNTFAGQTTMGMGLGAFGGGDAGFDTSGPMGLSMGGMIAGGAMFNPRFGRLMSRNSGGFLQPVQSAVQGRLFGATAGGGVDVVRNQLGYGNSGTDSDGRIHDGDHRFGRMGANLGTLLGGGAGASKLLGQKMIRNPELGSSLNKGWIGRQLGGDRTAQRNVAGFLHNAGNVGRGFNRGASDFGLSAMMRPFTLIGQGLGKIRHRWFPQWSAASRAARGVNPVTGAENAALMSRGTRIGRDVGLVGTAGMVGGGAYNMFTGQMADAADRKFQEYKGQVSQDVQNAFGMGQGGMVDQASSLLDPLLARAGFDPTTMHPAQKASLIAGGALGIGGMVTGNPMLALMGMGLGGAGAVSAKNTQQQQQQMLEYLQQLQGGGNGNFGQRNEAALQQQIQSNGMDGQGWQ